MIVLAVSARVRRERGEHKRRRALGGNVREPAPADALRQRYWSRTELMSWRAVRASMHQGPTGASCHNVWHYTGLRYLKADPRRVVPSSFRVKPYRGRVQLNATRAPGNCACDDRNVGGWSRRVAVGFPWRAGCSVTEQASSVAEQASSEAEEASPEAEQASSVSERLPGATGRPRSAVLRSARHSRWPLFELVPRS